METRLSRAKRSERRVARLTGGRLQKGSGCSFDQKGDVLTDVFLIECKTTEKNSYRLTVADLEKVRQQAVRYGRVPVMSIEMQGKRYWIMEAETAKRLTN